MWGALVNITEDGYSAGVEEFYYLLSVHNFDTKSRRKPTLGQDKKPVDNYVDASRNWQSYPQAPHLDESAITGISGFDQSRTLSMELLSFG